MNPVEIFTIKNKIPLYKGEEEASIVELIQLEEVGFEIVSRKDLYQIGDKAVYIQPDYNLSDIPLFESFIRPNGDESKSMLGKVEGKPRRIRAKKFNLSKEINGDPVYSNGILLPYDEVLIYINRFRAQSFDRPLFMLEGIDLTEHLCITKWEEPETNFFGLNVGRACAFPEGLYKTDETNIHNVFNNIKYPIVLVGTEKIDGSSITLGKMEGEVVICSRNMRKPLTYPKVTGRRKKTFIEKLLFWTKPNLNIIEIVSNDHDDFIKYGLPHAERVQEPNLILRGELHGKTCKGSGNKMNPASKVDNQVKFFGLDKLYNGNWMRVSHYDFIAYCEAFDFPTVEVFFEKKFNSFEEILTEAQSIFKERMIEGIVVRTLDSHFSAKIMNLEYDAKK